MVYIHIVRWCTVRITSNWNSIWNVGIEYALTFDCRNTFLLACYLHIFYYTKEVKICHRQPRDCISHERNDITYSFKAWTRFHVKWTVHYTWASPGSFICISEFFLIRSFVLKILCLYLPSQLSRLSLLASTASVFGVSVCVCASKRYTIDGSDSYLLPRSFLNQKLRRAMP